MQNATDEACLHLRRFGRNFAWRLGVRSGRDFFQCQNRQCGPVIVGLASLARPDAVLQGGIFGAQLRDLLGLRIHEPGCLFQFVAPFVVAESEILCQCQRSVTFVGALHQHKLELLARGLQCLEFGARSVQVSQCAKRRSRALRLRSAIREELDFFGTQKFTRAQLDEQITRPTRPSSNGKLRHLTRVVNEPGLSVIVRTNNQRDGGGC